MKQEKLKLLDLFSGIGGFSLGLESTGFFETIAFVEKDKFCQKILKKNFKNITIEGRYKKC
jgi:DNA (cytosine-5)-methyltransferase 1